MIVMPEKTEHKSLFLETKAASLKSIGKFDGDERRNGQFILSKVRLAIMASFGEVCSLKWP